MAKKVERTAHEPSWTEVILGAVLSIALGVVLGAAVLVLKPMTRVKAELKPEEREKNTLYFVEGARDPNKVKQALAKRKSLGEGQSVTVTEEELNAIVAPATPAAPVAAKAGEKAAAPAASAAPNFRIHDGRLQIAMPVNLDVAGLAISTLAVTRGTIVKTGDTYTFEPEEIYLGSCPLQRFPFAKGYVQQKFISSQPLPDDIANAVSKAKDVSIEGNTLKVTL